jgi:RNA polymerase sigma factor (sigma-70 family)
VRGPSERQGVAPERAPIIELADFEHCFEVNFVAVHRFIARRVGAPLADDLAAETFATAFRRRHSFDPSLASSRGWLFGIANNLVRGQWRAEQRMLALSSRLEAEAPSFGREAGPEAQVAGSGLAPRVARALASLPPGQRDVLLLHAWGGLADEEVAVALGLPAGTVRSRLWRARSALRSQLMQPDADLDVGEPLVRGASPGLAAEDGSREESGHGR